MTALAPLYEIAGEAPRDYATKACSVCAEIKDLRSFYKRPDSPDGYRNECIPCFNRRRRERYLRNREAELTAHRSYSKTEKGAIALRRAKENWNRRNPERNKAKRDVNNAVRDGRLVRHPCFVCGRPAEGHHPDYSRPLQVTWLCSTHHAKLHREFREILCQT